MKTLSVIGLSLLIALPPLTTAEARPHEVVVQEERGGDGDRGREQGGDRHRDGNRERDGDRHRDGNWDGDRHRDGNWDHDRHRDFRDRERYRVNYHSQEWPRYERPRYDYHRHWQSDRHWHGYPHHRPGYRVRTLPVGYKTVIAAGLTYFVLNEIWYQMHGPEYVVVEKPTVVYREVDVPPMVGDNGFYSIDVHGSRYYIKDGRYYRRNSDGEYLEVPPPD